jgi:hypothetical protein
MKIITKTLLLTALVVCSITGHANEKIIHQTAIQIAKAQKLNLAIDNQKVAKMHDSLEGLDDGIAYSSIVSDGKWPDGAVVPEYKPANLKRWAKFFKYVANNAKDNVDIRKFKKMLNNKSASDIKKNTRYTDKEIKWVKIELDKRIKTLTGMEKEMEKINLYQHNIEIFVATYQKLLKKGIKSTIIAKHLTNGAQLYKAQKHNKKDGIYLDQKDKKAFMEYVNTMQKLLKK